MTINDRIREFRFDLGLTQKNMAEKLEFSQSYISDVEHHRKKPSDKLLFRLQKIYDANIHWLKDGLGDMQKAKIDDETAKLMGIPVTDDAARLKYEEHMNKADFSWDTKVKESRDKLSHASDSISTISDSISIASDLLDDLNEERTYSALIVSRLKEENIELTERYSKLSTENKELKTEVEELRNVLTKLSNHIKNSGLEK